MNTLQELETKSAPRSKTFRVAFIGTTVSGVMYYRMCNFAWQMRKWPKVEAVVWPYSSTITTQNPWQVDMLNRDDIWQRVDYLCEKADIVVWQALDFEHSFELWQGMKARHQKPFVMELDDYLIDVPPENEAYQQFRPGSPRFRITMAQMRQSDALICSTPYLASQYAGMNQRIYVMPNSIDLPEWDGLGEKKHSRTRIGWIGGGTHSADLEMVQPVIEELTQKYKDVWFYCIHGVPSSYKKMPKVYWTHKWATINRYPKHLAAYNFDIGIAPLVDNNFNRGKSNLRFLEYGALKVPTVASPLPDFSRSIVSGRNGFIATELEDWKQALSTLIEDHGLRREMGRNAYATIKDRFNARKNANAYLRLLKDLSNV